MKLTKVKNFDKILEIARKHGGDIIGLFSKEGKLFARVVHYEGMVEIEVGEGEMDNDIYISTFQISQLSKLFREPTVNVTDKYVDVVEKSRKLRMAIMDVNMHPISYAQSHTVSVNAQEAYKLFNELVVFAGKDEYAKNFYGVYYDNDRKALVATDGFRLIYYPFDLGLSQSVLIPYKAVVDIVKLIKNSKNDIEILLNPHAIVFKNSEIVVVHKLYDVEFPNYSGVMAIDGEKSVGVLDSELVKNMINFLSVIKTDRITINYKNGSIELEAVSDGIILRDVFDVNMDREFQGIFINPKFLREALKALSILSNDVIKLTIMDASKPVRLSSSGVEILIMPIRG